MGNLDANLLDRPLRAFTYGRASRDHSKQGRSVAGQLDLNRSTCEERGWQVVDEFKDNDRSASRYARRARNDYETMIKRVRQGEADVIVYCDAARGYRDLQTYLDLRNLCETTGVLLCYNNRVYDMRNASDREHSAQDAVRAESEADTIRSRVKRGQGKSAREGRPHGRVPYGYRREYDPESGVLIGQVIYEPEAQIIREIATRIAAGASSHAIVKDLNARGISTPTGQGPWLVSNIKQTLLKPAYAGQRQYQKTVIGAAAWDAIIDPALYDRCESILTDPSRRSNHMTSVRWLLSGLATCQCGAFLTPKANRKIATYDCPDGFHTSISMVKFDLVVQAEVLAGIERPEFARALSASAPDDGSPALRANIAGYRQTLAEATDATAEGRLSVPRLTMLEQSLQAKIDAAEAELRRITRTVPQVVYEMADGNAREIWEELDLLERRQVLRAVTSLIQLKKAVHKGSRAITPDRYEVKLKW